eukprot:g14532.t1
MPQSIDYTRDRSDAPPAWMPSGRLDVQVRKLNWRGKKSFWRPHDRYKALTDNMARVIGRMHYQQGHHQWAKGVNWHWVVGAETGLDITSEMRSVLVDWLIEVHHKFRFEHHQTLWLTVSILDRFLTHYHLPSRRKLQLVGLACLLVASKVEETRPAIVDELGFICEHTYTDDQIREMEFTVVSTLFHHGHNLRVPTPQVFLLLELDDEAKQRQWSAPHEAEKESEELSLSAVPLDAMHENMRNLVAQYILELTLLDVSYAMYRPSALAKAALSCAEVLVRQKMYFDRVRWREFISLIGGEKAARFLAANSAAPSGAAVLDALKRPIEDDARPLVQKLYELACADPKQFTARNREGEALRPPTEMAAVHKYDRTSCWSHHNKKYSHERFMSVGKMFRRPEEPPVAATPGVHPGEEEDEGGAADHGAGAAAPQDGAGEADAAHNGGGGGNPHRGFNMAGAQEQARQDEARGRGLMGFPRRTTTRDVKEDHTEGMQPAKTKMNHNRYQTLK